MTILGDHLLSNTLILDGKAVAKRTEIELSDRVEKIKASTGITPILATILVGDDPASATYVKMKSQKGGIVAKISNNPEAGRQNVCKINELIRVFYEKIFETEVKKY